MAIGVFAWVVVRPRLSIPAVGSDRDATIGGMTVRGRRREARMTPFGLDVRRCRRIASPAASSASRSAVRRRSTRSATRCAPPRTGRRRRRRCSTSSRATPSSPTAARRGGRRPARRARGRRDARHRHRPHRLPGRRGGGAGARRRLRRRRRLQRAARRPLPAAGAPQGARRLLADRAAGLRRPTSATPDALGVRVFVDGVLAQPTRTGGAALGRAADRRRQRVHDARRRATCCSPGSRPARRGSRAGPTVAVEIDGLGRLGRGSRRARRPAMKRGRVAFAGAHARGDAGRRPAALRLADGRVVAEDDGRLAAAVRGRHDRRARPQLRRPREGAAAVATRRTSRSSS